MKTTNGEQKSHTSGLLKSCKSTNCTIYVLMKLNLNIVRFYFNLVVVLFTLLCIFIVIPAIQQFLLFYKINKTQIIKTTQKRIKLEVQ